MIPGVTSGPAHLATTRTTETGCSGMRWLWPEALNLAE